MCDSCLCLSVFACVPSTLCEGHITIVHRSHARSSRIALCYAQALAEVQQRLAQMGQSVDPQLQPLTGAQGGAFLRDSCLQPSAPPQQITAGGGGGGGHASAEFHVQTHFQVQVSLVRAQRLLPACSHHGGYSSCAEASISTFKDRSDACCPASHNRWIPDVGLGECCPRHHGIDESTPGYMVPTPTAAYAANGQPAPRMGNGKSSLPPNSRARRCGPQSASSSCNGHGRDRLAQKHGGQSNRQRKQDVSARYTAQLPPSAI